jgi:NADH-quinone oxidoreductase subunit L
MRITYITFFIGCLAIAGIPPFAGFFSKDEILAAAFANNPVLYYIGVAGALLTAFYMFRLLALTFTGKFRGTDEQLHHVHESNSVITIPLITLAILSAVGGLVGIPEIFMKNGHALGDFLTPVFANSKKINEHNVAAQTEIILMAASTVLILIVSIWAYRKFKINNPENIISETKESTGFAKAIKNKFYVDELYHALFVKPLQIFSNVLRKIDRSAIDGIVNGVGKSINYGSRQIRLLQSGQVGAYILLMVVGMLVLFIIQLFSK